MYYDRLSDDKVKKMLDQAENALFQLELGERTVKIEGPNGQIEFNRTDPQKLKNLILRLRKRLNLSTPPIRRPIKFTL
jgi:hypothetical protein